MADKMWGPRFFCGVLAFAALLAEPACSADLSAWAGTYTYEGQDGYDGGGTAATGSPIVLDMKIKIDSSGGCFLEADGFQTTETLVCTVKVLPDGTGIGIYFDKFPAGAIEVNGFFATDYAPNALLLSLVKGPALVTQWGAIKPDMAKTNQGAYFEKSAGEK